MTTCRGDAATACLPTTCYSNRVAVCVSDCMCVCVQSEAVAWTQSGQTGEVQVSLKHFVSKSSDMITKTNVCACTCTCEHSSVLDC